MSPTQEKIIERLANGDTLTRDRHHVGFDFYWADSTRVNYESIRALWDRGFVRIRHRASRDYPKGPGSWLWWTWRATITAAGRDALAREQQTHSSRLIG